MDKILTVNAPSVAGEVIDGEAVIMNLTTGHYFSTQGSGATVWEAVSAGATRAGIAAALTSRYVVTDEDVREAVNTFVTELLRHNLLVETSAHEDRAGIETQQMQGVVSRAPFHPLLLHVYTDMDDLLLLDPIHDVDEEGWPSPKPSPTTN